MEKFNLDKKFSSPEEELSYLKEYILNKERDLNSTKSYQEIEKTIKNTINDYAKAEPENVLQKGTMIPEKFRDEIVLQLKPEEHDEKMGELISIVYEKGIINALSIVLKLDDPHITDDFHRFLVQYLKEGYDVAGLSKESSMEKSLRRTLFEVTFSYDREENHDDEIKKFFELMEQFYFGMTSLGDLKQTDYFTLEIANSISSREFIFYISIPDTKAELLEKQLLSVFPNASISEQKDDFNVFNYSGASKGAYIMQKEIPPKVIRHHEKFNSDPINVLINVFSKLDEHKEAACIQMVFKPVGDFYLKNYNKALKKMEKGAKSAEELHVRNSFGSRLTTKLSNIMSGSPKKDKSETSQDPEAAKTLENLRDKISFPIVSTNFRIVTSAENEIRAENILKDIQSAFSQFENTGGNKFKFEEIKGGRKRNFFREFTFREFNQDYDMPLNLREIATVMHFPPGHSGGSPELKVNKMKTSSAPITISREGIYLGRNKHRNVETDIYYAKEDRLRHFYVIGQTGTGKTTILKNMIIQDIQNGEGVCMIDPHGSDIQDILSNVPKERYDDVIYFDPSYPDRPMALNMLEYDRSKPEQKTFVVNELLSIFNKLFDMKVAGGPMFEQYFRNATMLVIDDPESGSTLLDVSRVLADKSFRDMKLSRCKNPIVLQFWQEIAGKAGGEASLENIVPYITSKFDVFLANDIMRPVVAQEKSSFSFREIMDNRKILLVNLSKGSLGEINSSLIGLILVGKILMASLSRADSLGKDLPPFYLYIDEFQNVTTDSISTILSEARKYKLSLNIAHQFIAQLDEGIKDSVFGNVGSMAVFRVGSEDAEFLEKYFRPTFDSGDIMNIDNLNCYLKMLSGGVPIDAFSNKLVFDRGTMSPFAPRGDPQKVESLKQLSYFKYGQDRNVVEEQIMAKYRKEKKIVL